MPTSLPPERFRVRFREPEMLHPDVVQSVGFIVPRGTSRPMGTCFLIHVQSQEFGDLTHGYVVTANHNLNQKKKYEIWMTNSEGTLTKEIDVEHWVTDDIWDVAVASWPEEGPYRWLAGRIPNILYSSLGLRPTYGEVVLYTGLLGPIESMSQGGHPMVRAANIGFLGAEDVQYGGGKDSLTTRIAPLAHIIDCRSWVGFSGSPCWLVSPAPIDPREPDPGIERLRRDPRWKWVGDTVYVHGLWGMLVGYTVQEPHSVGVVIPIESIINIIEEDFDLKQLRKERTEAHAETIRRERDSNRIDEISAEVEGPTYRQEDFLADLRRVTRRTDTSQSDPEDPKTSA